MVILKQEVAPDFVAKAGYVLELAGRYPRLNRFAATVVFEHFRAIKPVRDMVALDEDP
jgi:hypothetical protein